MDAGEKLSTVDVGSEARQATLTFLIGRDFHLKGQDAPIDLMHEPDVTIKATPDRVPKPAPEAAMSVHIRSPGKDLVEVAVAAQGRDER